MPTGAKGEKVWTGKSIRSVLSIRSIWLAEPDNQRNQIDSVLPHLLMVQFLKERCLMNRTLIIIAALVFGLVQATAAADNRTTEGSKGITIDDYARGLKSAANNIEKEIPKMGSAIGNGFKKITQKSPEKSSEPAKQSK